MAGNQPNTLLVEVYFEGKNKQRITQTFEFKLIENENEPMIAVRPAPRSYRNITPQDIDMRLVIDEECNPVSAQVFDHPEKNVYSKDQLEYVKSSKAIADSQKSNYSIKTYPENSTNKSSESVKKHYNIESESMKEQPRGQQNLTSDSREIAVPSLQLVPIYEKTGKQSKSKNVPTVSTVNSLAPSSKSTDTKSSKRKNGGRPKEAIASHGRGDNLKKTSQISGQRSQQDKYKDPQKQQKDAVQISNERSGAEMFILNPESEENLVRTVSVEKPRSKWDGKTRVAALNQPSKSAKISDDGRTQVPALSQPSESVKVSDTSVRKNNEKSNVIEKGNQRVTIMSPTSETAKTSDTSEKKIEKTSETSQGLKSGQKSSLYKDKIFTIHVIMKNSQGKTKEVVTKFSNGSLPHEIVAEITEELCPKHKRKAKVNIRKRKLGKPSSAASGKRLNEVFKNDEIKAVSHPNMITKSGSEVSKPAESQETNQNQKMFLEHIQSVKENHKGSDDCEPVESSQEKPQEDSNDDIIFNFPICSEHKMEGICPGSEKPRDEHCLCQQILKRIGEAIATCSHVQDLKIQEACPEEKEPRKNYQTKKRKDEKPRESSSDEMVELSIPERKRKTRPKLVQNNRVYKLRKSPEDILRDEKISKICSREETSNSDYPENFKEKPKVIIPTAKVNHEKPEEKKLPTYNPKDFTTTEIKNPMDIDYPDSDESYIENVYREKPKKSHVCSCAKARVDSQVLEDQLISILQKIGLIYAEKSRDRTQKKEHSDLEDIEPLRGYSNEKRKYEIVEPLRPENKFKNESPEKIEKLRVSESFIKALKNQGSFKWSKSKRPDEYTMSLGNESVVQPTPSISWTPNESAHPYNIKVPDSIDTPGPERRLNKWAAKRKLFHERKDSDVEYCVTQKPQGSREPKLTRVCQSPYGGDIESSSSEEEYILLKVKKKKLDKNKATSTPKIQDVGLVSTEKPPEKIVTEKVPAKSEISSIEKTCWQKIEEQEKELQKLKEECKKMTKDRTKTSPPVEKSVSFVNEEKIEKKPEKRKSQVTKIQCPSGEIPSKKKLSSLPKEEDREKSGSTDKVLPIEKPNENSEAESQKSSPQVGRHVETIKNRRGAEEIKA